MPEPRYFLVQIEDGRKVRVAEDKVLGRRIGDPGEWRVGDRCGMALMVEARIDGSLFADDTCKVQVGVVQGFIVELEI